MLNYKDILDKYRKYFPKRKPYTPVPGQPPKRRHKAKTIALIIFAIGILAMIIASYNSLT